MTNFEAAITALRPFDKKLRNGDSYLDDAVTVLAKSIEQGWMWNVDFNGSKDSINRLLEDAADKIEKDHLLPLVRAHNAKYFYKSLEISAFDVRLSGLKSCTKKIAKDRKEWGDNPGFDAMQNLIDAMIPMAQAFESLKANIKKGRRPSENPSDTFKPTYSPKDFETIAVKFREVTADLREQQIEGVTIYVNRIIEKYLVDAEKPLGEKVRVPNGSNKRDPDFVYNDRRKYLQNVERIINVTLTDDYRKGPTFEQKVRKYAEFEVDYIHNQYISKNSTKLAAIIGRKQNLKEITLLSAEASSYNIESRMRFTFTDGSSFIVMNQSVWGTTERGSSFVRFPTTFHNVVKADGSKMAKPSEEKLNKEF